MYFQFLIEDQSGDVLIHAVMEKLTKIYPELTYDTKYFRGLGGFTKKNTVKETKTGKLLNDLATYMRGFNKSLASMEAAIFVVLDNDDRDTEQFRAELEEVASRNMIMIDHVFCVAVEEMEAWLLGDEQAILKAYPEAKQAVIRAYRQDSICGTWEALAEAVYPGGRAKMKKKGLTSNDVGKLKSEWAKNIGQYMEIASNRSPSFQYMISEIEKRAAG